MTKFTRLAFPIAFCATTALAVGTEDEIPPTPTETSTVCEDGQLYDEETETCVDSTEQSLNDDRRYDAVRELVYSGAFDRARKVIAAADTPDDPRFLNYRGFIAREEGRMDAAMVHYRAAIAANPDYLLARSYMGMGLVTMGRISEAKAQLVEIEARGGSRTWAHQALKQRIEGRSTYSY